VVRKYGEQSRLSAGGRALRWLEDYVAVPGRNAPRLFQSAAAVFGGIVGDTTRQVSPAQAEGKVVVFLLPPPDSSGRAPAGAGGARGSAGLAQRFAGAAAVATVDLDALTPAARRFLNNPAGSMPRTGEQPAPSPVTLRLSNAAANALFERPLTQLTPGTPGRLVTARLEYLEQPVPQYARNVIGVIRGSDPKLAGQYVAIGSHNDHVGFVAQPVDHDSARAFATAENLARIAGQELRELTPGQRAELRVNLDSLRALRAARRDSVNNGADDDGSGSMAMLEIAEAIARAAVKPKRSMLFVWHTGEEAGLLGSGYFVQHPTVPRDSIVAQLNIDMIGRGAQGDLPGGSPDYLAVVGSNMLSSQLGKAVADVNARQQPRPLALDYQFDQPSTWPGYNNLYNRSDHVHYARAGIPIAFFFTGLHQDYHRPTDEPQYIDYPHYTRITRYIHDLAVEIADRAERLKVDKPVS
jgi:hypothetical protein